MPICLLCQIWESKCTLKHSLFARLSRPKAHVLSLRHFNGPILVAFSSCLEGSVRTKWPDSTREELPSVITNTHSSGPLSELKYWGFGIPGRHMHIVLRPGMFGHCHTWCEGSNDRCSARLRAWFGWWITQLCKSVPLRTHLIKNQSDHGRS